ncbi:hypothetical protein AVEN_89758-1 [Araneus ventricosus]|uniref:Uncharacterized protein n=1 Tax=Araneus ventricosus TaxID=182803 RepID=A0A4Y2ISP3_ARAVE|nr:hypothetical protein AVEN_89758-1 [Araneus ventricosus]
MDLEESEKFCISFPVTKDLRNVVSQYQTQCTNALHINLTLQRTCAELLTKIPHLRLSNDFGDNFEDAKDKQKMASCNAKINKQKSDHSNSEKEHLIGQIRKITEENFNLRESKVKLQRLSKLEDKKIRNLQRIIETDKRKLNQNHIDMNAIQEQRNKIKSKMLEIQKLQQEIKETEKQMRTGTESVKRDKIAPKRISFQKKPQNSNSRMQNEKTPKSPAILPVILKLKDLLGELAIQVSEAEQNGKSCDLYTTFLSETQASILKLRNKLNLK